MAYVGNRGIKLFSHRDINQSDPTLNLACNDNGDDSYRGCRQDTRPFVLNCTSGSGPCLPWARYANEMENLGSSFYNGLQVTLTQRAFNGLNFLAGYTWAHARITPLPTGPVIRKTTAPSGQSGKWRLRYPPSLHFSMSYELPSLRAPLQMGQGWQLTSIVNLQTGEPYNYYDPSNDISYSGEFLDRWDFSGDPNDVHWTPDAAKRITYLDGDDALNNPRCAAQNKNPDLDFYGCFVSGSAVITPPAYGTFGNMRRSIFRSPAYANLDMSVTKRWNLSERVSLQLRGEFFNILNHPNFDLFTMRTRLSDPDSIGVIRATPDVGVANPVVGSGGSRNIQLGAKLVW